MDVKRGPDPRPALLLAGFAALLAALFTVAFVTGRLAGPVAPSMHRVATGTTHTGPTGTAPAGPGMHDMPGIDMP